MSQLETKRRKRFIASCNFCGSILQETQGDCKCNVICSRCGRTMAVIVRKGKVTVFEERYTENGLADSERRRMMSYEIGIAGNRQMLVAESSVGYDCTPHKR